MNHQAYLHLSFSGQHAKQHYVLHCVFGTTTSCVCSSKAAVCSQVDPLPGQKQMPEHTAQLRLVPKQRQLFRKTTIAPQALSAAWNCSNWHSALATSVATLQKRKTNPLSQLLYPCSTLQQMHHPLPSDSACVCLEWMWTCGFPTGAICTS